MSAKDNLRAVLYGVRIQTEGISRGYKEVLTTKEQGQLHQHINEIDKMIRRLKNEKA